MTQNIYFFLSFEQFWLIMAILEKNATNLCSSVYSPDFPNLSKVIVVGIAAEY